MSYNITKVSTKEPNSSGDITLNLEDVTSVSSPTDGQVLGYNGTNWLNETATWVNEYERSANTTSTDTSLTSTTQYAVPNSFIPSPYQYYIQWSNDYVFSTNYADVNTTSDITALTSGGPNAQWFYGFRFDTAGVYRFFVKYVIGNNSPDASSIEIQLSNYDNSVTYSPRIRIKNRNGKHAPLVGVVDASQNDVVGFYLHAKNGNAYYIYTHIDVLITIEKLS